jgi:hypothetical protein
MVTHFNRAAVSVGHYIVLIKMKGLLSYSSFYLSVYNAFFNLDRPQSVDS